MKLWASLWCSRPARGGPACPPYTSSLLFLNLSLPSSSRTFSSTPPPFFISPPQCKCDVCRANNHDSPFSAPHPYKFFFPPPPLSLLLPSFCRVPQPARPRPNVQPGRTGKLSHQCGNLICRCVQCQMSDAISQLTFPITCCKSHRNVWPRQLQCRLGRRN